MKPKSTLSILSILFFALIVLFSCSPKKHLKQFFRKTMLQNWNGGKMPVSGCLSTGGRFR